MSGDDETENERRDSPLTLWGRRVRAALVLQDLDPEFLATELNISRRTLERTLKGERDPRPWEVRRINEILKLPAWFLRDGLERPELVAQAETEDYRLRRVEELLREIAEGVSRLEER